MLSTTWKRITDLAFGGQPPFSDLPFTLCNADRCLEDNSRNSSNCLYVARSIYSPDKCSLALTNSILWAPNRRRDSRSAMSTVGGSCSIPSIFPFKSIIRRFIGCFLVLDDWWMLLSFWPRWAFSFQAWRLVSLRARCSYKVPTAPRLSIGHHPRSLHKWGLLRSLLDPQPSSRPILGEVALRYVAVHDMSIRLLCRFVMCDTMLSSHFY